QLLRSAVYVAIACTASATRARREGRVVVTTEDTQQLSSAQDLAALAQVHAYLIGALQRRGPGVGTTLVDACLYAVGPQGKMLRPALMLEACAAVGGN